MKIRVECYSGRKADEKPLRFWIGEQEYAVAEVLDQWYGPEDVCFRVRVDDGSVCVLCHQISEPDGSWKLGSRK